LLNIQLLILHGIQHNNWLTGATIGSRAAYPFGHQSSSLLNLKSSCCSIFSFLCSVVNHYSCFRPFSFAHCIFCSWNYDFWLPRVFKLVWAI